MYGIIGGKLLSVLSVRGRGVKKNSAEIIVRPTGILIEDGKILLVKQHVSDRRNWSLPGGRLEYGETIEHCLMREMKEETGLDIRLKELLYVCDRFRHLKSHVVHMTFLVERVGGEMRNGAELRKKGEPIHEIAAVPVEKLQDYGFSKKFCRLVRDDFPNRGTYQGEFHKFYDEES